MKNLKVVKIQYDTLVFDDGTKLSSHHEQNCCESHYLSFDDLDIKDFEGLEFDLTKDDFFSRISGYGISLRPIKGHPVRVAGYGSNNGYYSSDISLLITNSDGETIKSYDVTECQDIDWKD